MEDQNKSSDALHRMQSARSDLDVVTTDDIKEFDKFLHYLAHKYRPQIDQNASIDEDDLYQAGTMGIFYARQTWNSEVGPWDRWAMNKAHNAVIDLLRRTNGRSKIVEVDGQPVKINRRPLVVEYQEQKHDKLFADDEIINTDIRIDNEEIYALLRDLVATLPDRTQIMIDLYYRQDWTQRDIGEFYGLTESRISQIIGRSLAKMRKDERLPGLR